MCAKERTGPTSTPELFAEVKLADLGPRYDSLSLRAGIQSFVSDFRGFIFVENQPGVRAFGSFGANRWQWNAAAFELLEKDTNSGLNTTHKRHQRVGVANLYLQDFPADPPASPQPFAAPLPVECRQPPSP